MGCFRGCKFSGITTSPSEDIFAVLIFVPSIDLSSMRLTFLQLVIMPMVLFLRKPIYQRNLQKFPTIRYITLMYMHWVLTRLTSRDSFLTKGAEILWIRDPTAVLPVKEITETSGCFTIASPARGPEPKILLHTPGGKPGVGGGS